MTGQVVDPDGRGIPGAVVLLTDGTSVVARTLTVASGQFTLNMPDSGAFEIRVALDGFRGKPIAVTGSSAERDLGTIALEISAVSESIVVSAAQVEIPLSTAVVERHGDHPRRPGETPGRKRGRRAARRAWTVGRRQRRTRAR